MESQPPIVSPPAEKGRIRAPRSRRTWMGRIALPGVFALLLVALSATVATASEPVGTLLDGASAPPVDPLEAAVEPAVEAAGGMVDPILEPIVPDAPVLPTVPIAPILPVAPPVLPVLPILPVLESPVELAIPDLPDPAADKLVTSGSTAAAVHGPEQIVESSPSDAVATIGADVAEAGAAMARELVQSVEAAISGIGLTTDTSTSVMAGMLIGLSMAMAAGWSAISGQVRLRPIGLQLAPPVPPG